MSKENNGYVGNVDFLLTSIPMLLMQKKKHDLEDGSYWYEIGLSDGQNVIMMTCGKIGDQLTVFKRYEIGCNYENKKLKLMCYKEVA